MRNTAATTQTSVPLGLYHTVIFFITDLQHMRNETKRKLLKLQNLFHL